MADETPKPNLWELAVEAVEFNKVIVLGLLILVLIDKLTAFWLSTRPVADKEVVEFVLNSGQQFVQMVLAGVLGFLQGKSANRGA